MARPQINNLDMNLLKAAELHRQQGEFGITVEKFGAAQLKITEQYNIWKKCFQKLDESIKIMRKSLITEQIAECDKECDIAYSGIKGTIKTALKHFEPETRKAAKNISALLKNYGNITEKPIDEQISLVQNILQDFKNKFKADATKAGIDGWLERLETLNNKMIELNSARIGENAEKASISLKAARIKVISAYKDICLVINALVIMEGAANYKKIIATLNASNAKFGGKHTNSSGDTEEEPNEPIEPIEPIDPFANAREWKHSVKAGDFKLGDIFYIAEPNVPKKYYELIDEEHYNYFPNSDEGTLAWKRLV